MSFTFIIPRPLQHFTRNRRRVRVKGSAQSLYEAFTLLWTQFPGLRDRLITERRELRPHVNVFVGAANVRELDGLSTALRDGAEIMIAPALSGFGRLEQ